YRFVPVIAIIDDYADNRLLLRSVLGERYDIAEYASGVDALEGMRRSVPDLVLLDIQLPGMSGLEIVSRIRADDGLRHLPVLALTAHGFGMVREDYLRAGFSDHIHMPLLDETVLHATIARWLAKRDAAR
ncbi:MAG: response regulator, partial [Gemmatimonadaceae bacterium]